MDPFEIAVLLIVFGILLGAYPVITLLSTQKEPQQPNQKSKVVESQSSAAPSVNRRTRYVIIATLLGGFLGAVFSYLGTEAESSKLIATLTGFLFFGFFSGAFAWCLITIRAESAKPLPQQARYMTLHLTVPPIPWEPTQAVGLMNTLYQVAAKQRLTFLIVATSSTIRWLMQVPEDLIDTVQRSLLSYYPHADIAEVGDEEQAKIRHLAASSSSTNLRGATEYIGPLAYAADHPNLDPLVSIVGAMTQLEEGESVVYSVEVAPPAANYQKEGYKKITRSNVAPIILGLAAAAAGSRTTVIRGGHSQAKYEAQYQHLYQEKLNSPLRPVTLRVAIHAHDERRFKSIRESLISATSVFDRDDGNRLVVHEKAAPLILSPNEAAALWHFPSEDIRTAGIVRSSGAKAPLPVELLNQKSGLLLGMNTYQGKTLPVYLAQPDRITHMNITGKTRVGKTTFLHNLIHQDIAAGRGVGVIDPHGDLIHNILACSIPPDREKDVVLFDLADVAHPVALNLLYVPPGVQRHAAVGLTMGVLKKLFADQWSATRMEDALYSALTVLVDSEGTTIRDIPKLFNDSAYRLKLLARATDTVALEYWHDDYERMSERNQLEVARPIMHRIRAFYRNPVIERIVVQPVSLDFRAMMDEGKIFLASLAGEATQAEASIMGALLISKLQMAAMSRAQIPAERRRMFYLYVDEVQNFITTSLSTMFSEAAKYALSLTVANQYLSQLEGGTLEAVIGNTGTTVMFASGNQDAKDLGAYLKPTFDSQTLLNLDRFQTIIKMQHNGKTLPAFSMQTPRPPQVPADAAQRIQRIRQHAQERQIVTAAPPVEAEGKAIDSSATSVPSGSVDEVVPDLDL